MSTQELMALYRTSGAKCPFCKRIASRYEKTLKLSAEDALHIEECLLNR